MKRTERRLQIGFSTAILFLIVISVASYVSIRNLNNSSALVNHSNEVIATLESIISTMKDAETGQRGYLLSGEKQFLEPFEGALSEAMIGLDHFRKLTSDNPKQQRNAEIISGIIRYRLNILQLHIDYKHQGKPITAAGLRNGKRAMDALRSAVTVAESDEKTLLTERLRVSKRYIVATPIGILLAAFLAIAISVWAYQRVGSALKEKKKLFDALEQKAIETAEMNEEVAALNEELTASNEELMATNEELMTAREELELLNDNLEDQVTARTTELAKSESELAGLNEELTAANEELHDVIEELRASQHLTRSIVDNAPFAIGVYAGPEMRITMANQALIDVWDKGDKLVGKTYYEVLPELAGTGVYERLAKVYMTGIDYHTRYERVDLIVDGRLQPFYFNYSFSPVYNAEGRIYGVMNTATEVTDVIVAKQQVEQSEQNLRQIIAQAPVAMSLMTGENFVIEVANHLIIDLWGKPEADVLNKPIFDALPDARGQGLEEIMKRVYATGETFDANEMPVKLLRYGKEETVYLNFVYQAYRDLNGKIAGVLAIVIDVTLQVLARQRIEESEAELRRIGKRLEEELAVSRELQRQKDDFIGIASHELKTPLTSLSALIQMAQRKLTNSEDPFLARAMEKSTQQVRRMSVMINGFLNVARLEAGELHIEKTQFDMDVLVAELLEEATPTEAGHELTYSGCGEILVYADRDKIASVISNFLSNAVKYSPKGKRVYVTCITNENEVVLSVRDEGMGIAQRDLERIFDRYYRVPTQASYKIAGFGIGLYLSAEIIRHHDGRIWAESDGKTGSTFYFAISNTLAS